MKSGLAKRGWAPALRASSSVALAIARELDRACCTRGCSRCTAAAVCQGEPVVAGAYHSNASKSWTVCSDRIGWPESPAFETWERRVAASAGCLRRCGCYPGSSLLRRLSAVRALKHSSMCTVPPPPMRSRRLRMMGFLFSFLSSSFLVLGGIFPKPAAAAAT